METENNALKREVEAMEVQCKTGIEAAKSEAVEETRALRAKLAEEVEKLREIMKDVE